MRADRDEILSKGINLAIGRLESASGFVPFALALEDNGSMICVEAHEQVQDADNMIIALCNKLREIVERQSVKATAIVSDVKLYDQLTSNRDDAIRVELDDADSSPITCYLPYVVHQGIVEVDEVIAVGGGFEIF